MQYMSYSDEDGWDYRSYEQYLERWRPGLALDLADLLSEERLLMTGDHTLHDAYVSSLGRRFEPAVIADVPRRQSIRLELVGRYGDRVFELSYDDVEEFHSDRDWAALNDLDAHELVQDSEGRFRHHLQFRNGTMVIVCRLVRFDERHL